MNNIQKTIHNMIKNGGCKSKLLLAFKNSATLDEAKEEEVIAKHVKPCDTKVNKWGWYE